MTGDRVRTHKDLAVWQKAMELAVDVYGVTDGFPRQELYGLVGQIRRAAVSVPSNIAEGAARQSRAEYLRFASIALGSAAELETQLILAGRLGYCEQAHLNALLGRLEEIRRMLAALIAQLKRPAPR